MLERLTIKRRPGTVAERLEKMLLARIESGQLKAGERVPSTEELSDHLDAHPITVQRALQRMAGKGILERRPRLGTFVRPGHEVFRVSVLFGSSLTDENSRFYRALLRGLRESDSTPGWQCFPYDGINLVSDDPDPAASLDELPAFRHFLGDFQHYAFRGFIGIGIGDIQWDRIIRMANGLPTVRFGIDADIHFDYEHFGACATRQLLQAGARRIEYFRTLPEEYPPDDLNGIQRELRTHPEAELRVVQFGKRPPTYDEHEEVRFCLARVRQWIRSGRNPDAVLVSDDVTMRGLAHALTARGLGDTAAPRILCWANRGIRLHYGRSVWRYEVDPGAFAQTLTKTLVTRHAGKAYAPRHIRGRIIVDDEMED